MNQLQPKRLQISLLKRPHPFIFNRTSVLLPGLITILVVTVFAPFGLHRLQFAERIISGLLFGGICSFSILVGVRTLQKFFTGWFKEEKWTVGKEIMLFLAVSSLICFLIFFAVLYLKPLEESLWSIFGKTVLKSFLISSIPISILVLWEQFHHQRQQLKKAQELNQSLSQAPKKEAKTVESIKLFSEHGKEVLQLHPEVILYLKADSNYVDLHYLQEGALQKVIVRNRLKALHEQLPGSEFLPCHRSFIVNRNHILKVEGNARSLEIILKHHQIRIPVSRAKAKELALLINPEASH